LHKVHSQVNLEINQIDQLFESYSNIIEKTKKTKIDLVEITALASVLHSFYNGLENIFLCIARGIDHNVPKSKRWHRDILNLMGKTTKERNSVLSKETIQKLTDYLGFRHFYRHSYSFVLEWSEIKPLVIHLESVWQQVKKELWMFLNSIKD
jgi:hypothetical protein